MPESSVIDRNLSLCSSAPHRAILGLLAVALSKPEYQGLREDLATSPPEHLAAIANQSYGQVILHSAFQSVPDLAQLIPEDLAVYFAEMQRANIDRNQQAQAQLNEIMGILQPAGIQVLALKGAADVLDPLHANPGHRYISDLDLLVRTEQAPKAARLLRHAKGLATDGDLINPGNHHHLAQINSPDWLFTVELHVAAGSPAVSRVLHPTELFERAVPSSIHGLSVPSLEDRFLHHVLHGMELRHETARLNLRLLADHCQYLSKQSDQTQKQALKRLEHAGTGSWLTDLSDLTLALVGTEELKSDSWGARALGAFGNPDLARNQDNAFWLRHYWRRLTGSREYRRHILRKIFSPRAWAEFVAFHKDRRSKFK